MISTFTNDKPIPIAASLDAPDIFADGAVGAFVNNGNVHITLVARRGDYDSLPSRLIDVEIGRLVMPLPAGEQNGSVSRRSPEND